MRDPSNRYILGPDPYEGFPVLLSEGSARYRDIIEIIAVSSTMREFVESMHAYDGSFSADDLADEPERWMSHSTSTSCPATATATSPLTRGQ